MLRAFFGVGEQQTANYASFRFGYAMLTWAIVGNILQALSAILPHLFNRLFHLSTEIQLSSALLWVPLGLALSLRDTMDGKGLRNHRLEMEGRLSCSFIFIALTILLCEMSFR